MSRPKHLNGGRPKGSQNKSATEVGKFCREVLESPDFRQKLKDYFKYTAISSMDAKILALVFAYAYGKPKDRLEVSGPADGPVRFTLNLGGPLLVNGNGATSSQQL